MVRTTSLFLATTALCALSPALATAVGYQDTPRFAHVPRSVGVQSYSNAKSNPDAATYPPNSLQRRDDDVFPRDELKTDEDRVIADLEALELDTAHRTHAKDLKASERRRHRKKLGHRHHRGKHHHHHGKHHHHHGKHHNHHGKHHNHHGRKKHDSYRHSHWHNNKHNDKNRHQKFFKANHRNSAAIKAEETKIVDDLMELGRLEARDENLATLGASLFNAFHKPPTGTDQSKTSTASKVSTSQQPSAPAGAGLANQASGSSQTPAPAAPSAPVDPTSSTGGPNPAAGQQPGAPSDGSSQANPASAPPLPAAAPAAAPQTPGNSPLTPPNLAGAGAGAGPSSGVDPSSSMSGAGGMPGMGM